MLTCAIPLTPQVALDGFSAHSRSARHHAQKERDPTVRNVAVMKVEDQWHGVLLDPLFLERVTLFYLETSRWLHWLDSTTGGGSSSVSVLRKMPEFIFKDIARWFSWLGNRYPSSLSKCMQPRDVDVLVASTATMLARLDISCNPVPCAGLITLFRVLVESGGGGGRSRSSQSGGVGLGGHRGWSADGSGANDGQLAHAVFHNKDVQALLPASLLKIYYAVDMVEGLDVDKEDFDKYAVKGHAAKLLERIWAIRGHHDSIVVASTLPAFSDFVLAFVDHAAFMFGAACESLRVVRESSARASAAAHSPFGGHALGGAGAGGSRVVLDDAGFKATKAAASRLQVVTDHMAFVAGLSADGTVCQALCKPKIARRLASVMSKIMAAATGDADEVVSADVRTLDLPGLLLQVVAVCARILSHASPAEATTFIKELADDVDYADKSITQSVAMVTKRTSVFLSRAELELFGTIPARVAEVAPQRRTPLLPSSAPPSTPLLPAVNPFGALFGSGAAAAAAGSGSAGSSNIGANTRVNPAHTVQELVDVEPAAYKERMADFGFSTTSFADEETGEYYHAFAARIRSSGSPSPKKMKRLLKEIKAFKSGKTDLPLHPGAAIFLAVDENRMDVARAVITGPVDTPYALGCFAFDIFFPDNYPNEAPLVKLITTGSGTVRFNPNL